MNTLIRNASGIHEVSIEALLRSKRSLYLEGPITSESAAAMIKEVMYLIQADQYSPIKVFINSAGGNIAAGMAIYDVIQGTKTPINLYCIEKAYSMAALIFASGKNGRYILPHSKVMLHEPLIGEGVGGNTSSVQKISTELTKIKDAIDALIVKHTGKASDEVAKVTKEDTFFTAQEAVEFGLADGIKNFDEMLENE